MGEGGGAAGGVTCPSIPCAGSDYFNRSLRHWVNQVRGDHGAGPTRSILHASCHSAQCGWSLSDQGLRPVASGARVQVDERTLAGLSIRVATEADIFAACGCPYRTPAQRDVTGGAVGLPAGGPVAAVDVTAMSGGGVMEDGPGEGDAGDDVMQFWLHAQGADGESEGPGEGEM